MKKNLTHKLLSGFLAVIMTASSVTTPVFASDEQLVESTVLEAESTADPAESVAVVVDEDGMIHLEETEEAGTEAADAAEKADTVASGSTQMEEPVSEPEQPNETSAVSSEEEPAEPAQHEPVQEEEERFASLDPDSILSEAELNKIDFSSKRLLVAADTDVILDPEHVLSEYNGVFLLQYESAETARNAFSYYYGLAEFVEVDATVSIADEPYAESAVAEKEMTEAENPLAALAESAEYAQKEARQEAKEKLPLIAVIDTGASTSENIVEAISMIDADPMDQNGHGTNMIAVITAQNPDARILSIKALGADGTGDVSAVYAAIQYAIERGASYINLSISALASADNELIGQIITDAVSSGITVVGAAGNNHRNAKYYIPGSIDAAVVVGACDEDGNRLAASNYGDSVDYYAKAASTSEAAAIVTGLMSAGTFEADGSIVVIPKIADENPETTPAPDADPDYLEVQAMTDDEVRAAVEAMIAQANMKGGGQPNQTKRDEYLLHRYALILQAETGNFVTSDWVNTVPATQVQIVDYCSPDYHTTPSGWVQSINLFTDPIYNNGNTGHGGAYNIDKTTRRVMYCSDVSKDGMVWGKANDNGYDRESDAKTRTALSYVLAHGLGTFGGDRSADATYRGKDTYMDYAITQAAIWGVLYGQPNYNGTRRGINASTYGVKLPAAATKLGWTQADANSALTKVRNLVAAAKAYANAHPNGYPTDVDVTVSNTNMTYNASTGNYESEWITVNCDGEVNSKTITLSGNAGARYVWNDANTQVKVSIPASYASLGQTVTVKATAKFTVYDNVRYKWKDTSVQRFTMMTKADDVEDSDSVTLNLVEGEKSITLIKVSANPSQTNGQSGFDMTGAVYTIYTDSACETSTGKTFTVNSYNTETSSATTNTVRLPNGTYYYKETTPPTNGSYLLDTTVHTFTIDSDTQVPTIFNASDTSASGLQVISQPTDMTIAPGSMYKFILNLNNESGTTYQWQVKESASSDWRDFTEKQSSRTKQLWFTVTSDMNNWQFRCVATNGSNTLTSTPFTVKTTGTPTDVIVYVEAKESPGMGKVNMKKTSSRTADTNGNTAYNMNGAVYTIYRDSACTDSTGETLTLGSYDAATSSATSNTVELPLGTYYLKETTAPTNGSYKLSTTVTPFEITADYVTNALTVSVTDEPSIPRITLNKTSAKPTITNGNSSYNMVGIKYTVYKNAACTQSTGKTFTINSYNAATSTGTSTAIELPAGTYYLKETTVPAGSNYVKSDAVTTLKITANENTKSVNVTDAGQVGYIRLVKTSSDTTKTNGSADYDMTGATYSVTNTETKAVVGNLVVGTYDKTTSTGTTNTLEVPLGSYELVETEGPTSGTYAVNTAKITATVTANNVTTATAVVAAQTETPGQGKASLKKVSASTSVTNNNSTYTMVGAEYTIYKDSACTQSTGQKFTIGTYTASNSTGTSNTVTLPYGTYYAKETKAPTSGTYKLDTTVRSFTLTKDHASATLVVAATDPPEQGKLTLAKKSSNTAVTNNNNQYSMVGAEYTIYKDQACTTKATNTVLKVSSYNAATSTATTNTVTLPFGTYYVKETKAPTATPSNYTLSTVVTKVVVGTANKTTAVSANVTETPVQGYLKLVKTSSDTAKTNGSSKYDMTGAEYSIHSETQNKDMTEKLTVTSYDRATSTGTTNTVQLPIGTYTLTETKGPGNGSYSINTTPITVTVTADHTTVATAVVANDLETPSEGGAVLKKVSSDTTITNGNNNYSMAGAEYTIYKDSACTQSTGKKFTIGAYSAANSTGTSNTVSLPLGTYYAKETKAPTNGSYELDTTVRSFTLSPDNATATVTVNATDPPVIGKFNIRKESSNHDATDNNDAYSMMGAQYTVYTDSAATASTGKVLTIGSYDKTTSTGTSNTVELPIGTYYIKETKAPTATNANYKMSTTITKIVVTKDHKTTALTTTVKEEPELGYITLVKVSSDTSKTNGKTSYSMLGAEYTIKSVRTNADLTDKLIVTSYDAATSTARTNVVAVPLGDYTVRETKAPTNGSYELNTAVINVSVTKANKTETAAAVVNAQEAPASGGVSIKKVSSKTNVSNGNTAYSMAGAEYTIFTDSACTQAIGEKLVISSYASATSTGTSNTVSLPLGTYYVKETKAPTNGTYKLNTTVYTFEITEDNLTENLVVNVTDEPVTTFFQIKKTSTDTNATNNNDSYDMTGAEYTVYKNAAATTSTGKKATITSYDKTTSTGTSTKVELPIGTYYVKETKAPTGANGNYKLSTAITKVVVTKDHTTSTPLSVSVTDEPKLGYLKLVKTSSNTSKTNGKTDYDMTGAKYSVTSVRTGEVVGTLTVTSYDAATSTGTTGTLTLPLGEYTLKETKAPTNGSFALSTETVSVTVTKSNLTTATAAVASALETPVDGKAVLKKVSSDTSITNGNSTYTMAGAEYTIYKDADCTQSTGKKFTIGTYTAANSTGTSNTVTLPLGTYYAKETKAPTSGTYKLDTTVRSFTLTKDNVSAALTVNATDPPEQGQITLVKKSSDTASTNGNSNYSMMGAEYTIYKNQACTRSTGKVLTVTSYNAATSTGTTGTATLPFGTYYVKETKAPTAAQANYEMSTAVTEVVVGVAAKTTPVTTNVTETPLYGYLTLEKVSATPDTTNGNSDYDMTGAEYSITEQGKTTARPEKLTVTSYDTATSTARTNTVKLPIGTYILKETKAPTNGSYTLSTATITAVVTAGHTTTAPLVAHATESPKSGKLKIEKVSSDHTTTDGRTEYSAIGAVYTIYTNDACTESTGQTLTINSYDAATSTGTSGEVTLPLGTYYLKETTAPTNKSYKLNTTVYTAEVTTDHVTNALTVSATDAPEVGRARLRKDSAHTANTNNNPAYSSVGAVYRIYSDSACKNATGKEFKVNSYTTSDSRGWSNVVTLPFGTYWAKEVTLPTNGSFKLNATAIKFTVTPDNISSNSTVAAKDEEVMGYLSIEKESANHALTDGNDGYDMTGATFSVVNKDSGKEEGTLTISSYNTATSKGTSNTLQVPLGTYTLTETSAPANGSYEINTTPIEVTVTTSNVTTATAVMAHQTETPGMNPFLMALQKIDSVTGESKPEGNATLAGAEFTLRFYAVDPATHTTAASVSSLAPAKTWVIETKKVGNAYRAMLSAAYLKSGDTFYGTNAAGNASLPYGVLTITETKAPTGYQAAHSYKAGGSTISDTTIAVQIAPGGNKLVIADSTIAEPDVLDANEKPYLGGIKIVKYDSSTSDGTAEGDADLSGIRFELKNASDNAVTVSGTSYAPGAVIMTLTTNASGKAQTNNKVLPYGRYTVQEVASNGKYRLTDGEAHTVTVNSTTSVTENFYNEVTRGGGAVVKLDAETANGAAQGDGDFSGITFRIVNRSAKPVVLKNGTVVPVGGEVMTITTDASGHAATEADALPYGTYEITEISANNAYLLTDTTPQTITIREDGQIESVTFRNLIKRGGVEVVKHDAETGTNVPLGTATLEGITFTITNASTKAVMIGGTSYAPNAVVATITTSADGIARTSVDALPYGTYKIRETATNDTYLLTDGSEKTFEIRNSGELVSTDTAGRPLVFTNQVKRGDFRIVKTDKDTNAPMPNVRFLITSNTTGEAHEVMTGADGTYDSSQIRHSLNTNRGQAGDGVWFGLGAASGRTDDGDTPAQLPVKDDVGALPLGTYTITELDSGEANRGSLLITQEFEITAEGVATVLLLEIKDNVPKISTEAKAENGTNYLDAKSPVTITDTVTYSGLIPGRTYQLTGTLYERLADGSAQNLNITSQPVDFTPAEEAGSQPVVFTFDSTALAGKTLVVYEKLFEGGVQVAEHEDINDEAQTLHVVSIDTTATANETGTHSVMNRASVTITDRVEYKGLDPTKTYTMRGVLMSKETGAPILVNGAQVTATQTFKPAQPNGTIDMTYTFNAHALAGNHIVVFEELLLDSTVIADHKDIDDDDQTVYIAPKPPTLHTGGEGTGMFHLSGIFMGLILMIAEAFRRRRRKIA